MNDTTQSVKTKGDETSAQNLLYDAPLVSPEQDRLGRAEFSRFLAKAILKMDAEEGFVFGLYGPWGSGKTSILNFVLSFIEKDLKQKFVVVRFNPWWFSGREQLLYQFFQQFKATLRSRDVSKNLQKVSQHLDRLANVLEPLTLIPGVGGWIDRAKNLSKSSGAAAKAAAEALEKDVHGIRALIDAELRKQSDRILVVIDDIDRLPAEEIRQIFQVVKAVADFPKTIYLLAFDHKMVAAALTQLQGAAGEEYIEKIIQAPFDLPLPDRTSLRHLFFEQLQEILQGTPEDLWDETEWGNVYWGGIDPFVRTPRDMKRFVNILRATYPIVKGEVNPTDFVGIQALRLFAAEMYHFAASNKDDLAGAEHDSLNSDERPEVRRNRFDVVVDALAKAKQKPVKDLMTRLFPKWSFAYGGSSYGPEFLSYWRKNLRVCSPDIFDRYFMLSILPGEISSVEMRAILTGASNSEIFGNELLKLATEHRPDGTTRLRMFLERIQDLTEHDIPIEHIEPILRAIYNVGDQLFLDEDRAGMLDRGNDVRLLRISYQLLKRLAAQRERYDMLRKIFLQAKSISLLTRTVIALGQEHGKYDARGPTQPEESRTVSQEHLTQLEQIALHKLRAAAQEKWLHAAPDFAFLLYRLSNWGSENEAKHYASKLIVEDVGLCDFFSGFLQSNYSHGLSDRVARRTWRIYLPSIQKFLGDDPSVLIPRCEKILKAAPSWLNQRRKLALETFITEVKEPLDEWGRPR